MIVALVLLLICLSLLYVLCDYLHHVFSLNKYPPGPFPLPVIGNLHLLGPNPHEDFHLLTKKYGDVYGLSFGMNRLVVVNAIEPAKEALVSKGVDFAGRGTSSMMIDLTSRGFKDMVFADYGDHWKFHRKLAHAALASYGQGNGNIEEKIKMEAKALNLRLQNANGKPVNVHVELGCSLINIICAICFGQRYNVEDEDFRKILKFNNFIVEALAFGDPTAYLPWLRFFPMKNLVKLKEGIAIRDKFLQKKVKERMKTFDPDNVHDFTDSLIKTSGFQSMGDGHKRNDDNLDLLLADMIGAGSETTATALRWLVVYFLHWPHIQREVYNEILTVVGTQRYPELEDQPNLHLCQATIQETLRFSSLAPLGLPHKSVKDSSIAGMKIPRNTEVFFNLWSMNHDAREWRDPKSFNPYRWLNESGEYVPKRHHSFLPFSAGRRGCLGESLARKELFIIFTRLVRDFRIEPNEDEKLPSLRGCSGVVLAPHPFTTIFTARK